MWISSSGTIPQAISSVIVDSGRLDPGRYLLTVLIENLHQDPFVLRQIDWRGKVRNQQTFHSCGKLNVSLTAAAAYADKFQVLTTVNGTAASVSLSLTPSDVRSPSFFRLLIDRIFKRDTQWA